MSFTIAVFGNYDAFIFTKKFICVFEAAIARSEDFAIGAKLAIAKGQKATERMQNERG